MYISYTAYIEFLNVQWCDVTYVVEGGGGPFKCDESVTEGRGP